MTSSSKQYKRSRDREYNGNGVNEIIAYTDASCKSGVVGYSFIVLNCNKNKILHLDTFSDNISCNSHEGELLAVLGVLTWYSNGSQRANKLKVYTDSKYIVNTFNHKMDKWANDNNWKSNIRHKKIWMEIYRLKKNVTISWVKGHSSDPWNILADYLAGEANSTYKKSV